MVRGSGSSRGVGFDDLRTSPLGSYESSCYVPRLGQTSGCRGPLCRIGGTFTAKLRATCHPCYRSRRGRNRGRSDPSFPSGPRAPGSLLSIVVPEALALQCPPSRVSPLSRPSCERGYGLSYRRLWVEPRGGCD